MTNGHDSHEEGHGNKHAAVNGLAIVGFVGLIIGGILLAVYAARFVPETLSRLSSAVYLSEDKDKTPTETDTTPNEEQPVVEEPEAPITFPEDNTPVATTTKPRTVTPVTRTHTVVTQVPAQLYGDPDLSVAILATGYMQTSSTASFREADEVPKNRLPAIRYQVRNDGTNSVTRTWKVRIAYPAESGTETYVITTMDDLMPGGYKNFTFGFDDGEVGRNQNFTVTVDSDNAIDESNERNNRDSATVDIR